MANTLDTKGVFQVVQYGAGNVDKKRKMHYYEKQTKFLTKKEGNVWKHRKG